MREIPGEFGTRDHNPFSRHVDDARVGSAESKQPKIPVLYHRLEVLEKQAREVAAGANAIVNQLLGSVPENEDSEAPPPVEGVLEALDQLASSASARLDRAQRAMNRLAAALGL